MRLAVYLPLLIPVLAAWAAGPLSRRLQPRQGTWLLTVGAVVLAACSTLALGLLATTAAVRVPLLASLGEYSLDVVRRDDPAAVSVAIAAGFLLVAATVAAVLMVSRRVSAVLAAFHQARRLPGHHQVVVLADDAADAFALPGRPGRVVISTAMLDALDPAEQEVLLAHEQAHLACRHYLFLAAVHLAAAANPLLRPVATAVGFTIERWADEHAASQTGDRRLTACTIGKAALASTRIPRGAARPGPELALSITSGVPSLAGAGPVPRRVAALLAAPPRRRTLLLVAAVAVVAASGAAAIEGSKDLEALLELACAAARR